MIVRLDQDALRIFESALEQRCCGRQMSRAPTQRTSCTDSSGVTLIALAMIIVDCVVPVSLCHFACSQGPAVLLGPRPLNCFTVRTTGTFEVVERKVVPTFALVCRRVELGNARNDLNLHESLDVLPTNVLEVAHG